MSTWHRPSSPQNDQMKDLVPPKAAAPTPPPPRWRMWLLPIGLAISVLLLFNLGNKGTTPHTFTYTSFVKEVTSNKVSTATITSTGSVTGNLHGGGTYTSQVPTALDNNALSPLLLSHKVQVTGTSPSSLSLGTVLLDLCRSLPLSACSSG
jgi:cell division protease FtsH